MNRLKKKPDKKSDFLQGVASSLFLEALVRLTISPQGLFVLNQIDKGVLQYRKSLGIAADYQLFEASMKRTNAMVSQGQLWLNISGAAISFSRDVQLYGCALCSDCDPLPSGGEGITSAAKIPSTDSLR
uniref:Uncharacterized protein n=1 Tax=Klebsiella pneumoniae TaxID=573 RepID=A0A8B0SUR2_KLEPN|nr:hypothetical protein [Klebsiella pneumoniae]